MVGLSHRALRELILDFGGLDLAFTEMASAAAAVSGSVYESFYLDAQPYPAKTCLQFYTVKPERLVEALAHVRESGVFGIDINFGCSAPAIKRAGGGVAWMKDPAGAAELIGLSRAAWAGVLSSKVRIGENEDFPFLLDFCAGLAARGLDFLTLHPRLDSEKFRRKSRWDYVARLAEALPIPVVGNGDILSVGDYEERRAEARPAGFMLGRGAVRRPWIFALIRGRAEAADYCLEVDLEATAHRFLDLVEKRLPPDFHLTRARRFFSFYSDNFSYAHHLKWKLDNAADLGTMRAILQDYFAEVPQDKRRLERD
jgi:tRNA-dihydrouridine synthase